MKGFIRRDLYHLGLNMKFYLVFMVVMAVVAVISEFSISLLYLYAVIFSASSLVSLFNYDEANNWQAYAATAPNGRREQVRGRYVVAIGLSAVVTLLLMAVTLLSTSLSHWPVPLLYGGILLLYIDVMFPLTYRFASKSRLVLVIMLGCIAAILGAGSGMLILSGGSDHGMAGLSSLSLPLIGIGLVGMVLSHRISATIMKRKEL